MKRKTLFILLALVLIAVIGFLYFFFMPRYIQNKQVAALNDARTALSNQDYTSAINISTAVLKDPVNPANKGWSEIILAESLWGRNQSDDRTQALTYYKKVVADYTIPAPLRALSLNDISIIMNQNSFSYYRENFSEAPYNTFLLANGDDSAKVAYAYSKILQLSDETYPNSYAEYALAGNYYTPSVYFKLTTDNPEDVAKKMQTLVTEADNQYDRSLYSPLTISLGLLYRALAINISGGILGTYSQQQMEEAYQRILSTSDQFPQDESSVTLRARFYYAGLVLEPTSQRTVDIVELLKPFSQVPSGTRVTFFSRLKTKSASNPLKIVALKLTKISPDFKAFYDSL
jgi:hypothetical protein